MFNLLKSFFGKILSSKTLYVAFDSGAKNKPTIVLLHGIAATSNAWNLLIKELDIKKNRIVALDLLGFGKSPRPMGCDYSVGEHVKYIHKTIKKLKIKQPYVIIGHSMGSIIAAHYCRTYCEEIKKAYLLSLPLYAKNNELSKFLFDKQTDVFIAAYNFLLENKNFTINNSKLLRKLLNINDSIDVNEENWEAFRLSLKNTIIHQNAYEDIKNSKIPIDIIYGDMDGLLVQKNVDELALFKHVNVTKLNIVGHTINARFAKLVAQKINES